MSSKNQTPFGKKVELTCSQQPHIALAEMPRVTRKV